jgi:NADP-reducing hydrogenase subunit HndC
MHCITRLASGLSEDVQIVKTGCFGFCEKGPIVKVLPEETFYVQVKPADAAEIVQEHLVKGRPVTRLLYDPQQSKAHAKLEDIDFYQKQVRIVLRNCGVIDPDSIDEYIARDGYVALEKVLFEMTPEAGDRRVAQVRLARAWRCGFPDLAEVGVHASGCSEEKYVMCNADEGDPGAYMDRSTLEGDPHSILEAMMIAGYTCGSSKGIIYIRAEYPLAIERLNRAIAQAKEYG